MLESLSAEEPIWSVDVYWCFMTCYDPKSLWKLGQITTPSDILNINWQILPEHFEQFHGLELIVTYGKGSCYIQFNIFNLS